MPVSEAAKEPTRSRDGLAGRAGLTVPADWWASAPLLKSLEAAGFGWTQVHAPPPSVLADPRALLRHSTALGEALATTGLGCVVHAPDGAVSGSRAGDRVFEGLLDYAAEIGAELVVYHALALPDATESEGRLREEARSLAKLATRAERLGVTIAVENLAPVFPGPEVLSANPMSLRSLAKGIGSERVGLCLDLGHAHIVAELRRTSIERLIEPVLDVARLFHVHDNLGARRGAGRRALGVDPLKLDLHLPPGRGTLPWERLASRLSAHRAPLVMEVHPPFRPRAAEALACLRRALET